MAHRNGAEGFGQAARQHATHFQRISDAGRYLSVVGEDVPPAITQPHEIDGVVGKVAGRRHPIGDPAGAVEMPIGMDQHRRQPPLLQEGLGAVDVGQDGVEQAGALDQAGLERRPFVGCHDERQGVERPARCRAVVQQVDGGARFLELALCAFDALAQAARQRADDAQDALPVVADRLLAGDQFVVRACRRREKAAQRLHGPAEGRNLNGQNRMRQGRGLPHARRRSSVRGCSGFSIRRGSGRSPGVWPIGKKRARRRASASLALTGTRS